MRVRRSDAVVAEDNAFFGLTAPIRGRGREACRGGAHAQYTQKGDTAASATGAMHPRHRRNAPPFRYLVSSSAPVCPLRARADRSLANGTLIRLWGPACDIARSLRPGGPAPVSASQRCFVFHACGSIRWTPFWRRMMWPGPRGTRPLWRPRLAGFGAPAFRLLDTSPRPSPAPESNPPQSSPSPGQPPPPTPAPVFVPAGPAARVAPRAQGLSGSAPARRPGRRRLVRRGARSWRPERRLWRRWDPRRGQRAGRGRRWRA